jgi:hypothetical protein
MTPIRFELGANVLQFSVNRVGPVTRPFEKIQVMDRVASGELQREDLGIDIKTRTISFVGMPAADYAALITWFDTIANGAENEFTFINELSEEKTVIITSPKISFSEQAGRFSGNLELEVVE